MKIESDLCGVHLHIRNYQESDLPFLTDMWFDKENGKYLSDPTKEYIDEAFQHALDTLGESQFGYYLVIELADSHEPVGSCCMFPDESGKVYDIGYCIHKDKWRMGYGSEAVSLILMWMKSRSVKKVTAEVAVCNIPSNSLLQKLGFQIEKKASFKKYNMDTVFESYIYMKLL